MSDDADDHAERVAEYLQKNGYEINAAVGIRPGLRVPDLRPDHEYGLVDIVLQGKGEVIHVEIELPMSKWEGKYAFDLRRRLRPKIKRFQSNTNVDRLWILTHKQYFERLSCALNQVFKWRPEAVENYLDLDESFLWRSRSLLFGWYRFTRGNHVRDIELQVPVGVGRIRLETECSWRI